jgi:hypothetical protein
MATLELTRHRGWSYAVGWHQEQRAYHARAWKQRPQPKRTKQGVLLVLHSLSATGDTLDQAAELCAACVVRRESGVEHEDYLSDCERRFVEVVSGWKP